MPTDPILVYAAIAAAIVSVLTALSAFGLMIINGVSSYKDRREAAKERLAQMTVALSTAKSAAEVSEKADAIILDTAKIHELTNSTNSDLQTALKLMTEKVLGQEKLISQMTIAKGDLAEAKRDLAESNGKSKSNN